MFVDSAFARECRMKLLSPCKINLHLKVFEKTPQGYHRIQTLMVKVALFDEMHVEIDKTDLIQIFVRSMPKLDGENNILFKTVKLFQEATGIGFGINIDLKKNIPMGAGLAGGSGNAASLLTFLNDHFQANLTVEALVKLSVSLGTDVAFFLRPHDWGVYGDLGQTMQTSGTCEKLPLVLCYPKVVQDTGLMYKRLSRPLTWEGASDKSPTSCFHVRNWADFKKVLPFENDFESVITEDWLEPMKRAMKETGASFAQMSGSGSSVFGLFDRQEDAKGAVDRLADFGVVFQTHIGI